MHKSAHNSSVPDSYTLLFIVKSYLNDSVLVSDMYVYMYVCMHVCTKSLLKPQQIHCVFAHTWRIKLIVNIRVAIW